MIGSVMHKGVCPHFYREAAGTTAQKITAALKLRAVKEVLSELNSEIVAVVRASITWNRHETSKDLIREMNTKWRGLLIT